MITNGPKIYLVKRHDGKEIHVRDNPFAAMQDYLGYHKANRYEVEELSASSLLWWTPRVKAQEWEPYPKVKR